MLQYIIEVALVIDSDRGIESADEAVRLVESLNEALLILNRDADLGSPQLLLPSHSLPRFSVQSLGGEEENDGL